jgi:2-polyprenyl-6-methoxyphenol hydroxylase-like FAD-dependent oxidoreductase
VTGIFVCADLGQGVNSAFLDVRALVEALGAQPDDLAAGLRAYEATQLPEARALCRIQQVRTATRCIASAVLQAL